MAVNQVIVMLVRNWSLRRLKGTFLLPKNIINCISLVEDHHVFSK